MKLVQIEELLKMLKEYGVLVIGIVALIQLAIKNILASALDKVFMTKEKQVTNFVLQGIILFFILLVVYISFGVILPFAIPKIFCIIYIILFFPMCIVTIFWLIVCFAKKIRKKIKEKVLNIIWIIYYLYFVIFGIVMETFCVEDENIVMLNQRILLSSSITCIVYAFLYIAVMALKQRQDREEVFFYSEEFGKLYLLNAFDKDNILCKVENSKKMEEYVIISRKKIEGKSIFIKMKKEN